MPRGNWLIVSGVLVGLFYGLAETSAQSSRTKSAWSTDLKTAESEAARLGRPLVVHFYADWCVPCRRMERDVLSSPELAAQLKSNFVGVKVDADRHPELLQRFGVRSLPADVVVDSTGRVLVQTQGYQTKVNYIGRLARLGQRLRPAPNPVPPTPAPLGPGSPAESIAKNPAPTQPVKEESRTEPPPFDNRQMAPGMDGYSPVSLFNWREWRKGNSEFTAYHKGIAYHLASKTELDEFAADPEKFVPRLLGCDPVILQKTDRAVPGSTKYGAYYDGRLFLFQSPETRAEFKKSPSRFVKTRHVLKADQILRQSAKPADTNLK